MRKKTKLLKVRENRRFTWVVKTRKLARGPVKLPTSSNCGK
jgi:hypothetical protein